jgi:hypothetical protein|nr:MAG TPA: hypothetical protein [Caudoviricetes sp.]
MINWNKKCASGAATLIKAHGKIIVSKLYIIIEEKERRNLCH